MLVAVVGAARTLAAVSLSAASAVDDDEDGASTAVVGEVVVSGGMGGASSLLSKIHTAVRNIPHTKPNSCWKMPQSLRTPMAMEGYHGVRQDGAPKGGTLPD